MRPVILIALLITGFSLCSVPCRAEDAPEGPSFDCAKASTFIEKLICASPSLSQQDRFLATSYAAKLKTLTNADAKALVIEQRKWLANRLAACRISPTGTVPEFLDHDSDLGRDSAQGCLFGVYRQRILDLNSKTVVLYSEDDGLCKPLAKLYDELGYIHTYMEKETHDSDPGPVFGSFPTNIIWETAYRDRFAAIGLKTPHPLEYSQGCPWNNDCPESAEYRVRLSAHGPMRLITLDDDVSRNGSPYVGGTNLSILSRDSQYSQPESQIPDVDQYNTDLSVLFSTENHPADPDSKDNNPEDDDKTISLPYWFEKLDSRKSLDDYRRYLDGSAIQRVFEYKGGAVFTARDGTLLLVYRVMEDGRMDDVCYIEKSDIDHDPFISH